MKLRVPRRPQDKVVVGYPVGGSVTLAFHASMLRMLGYEIAKADDDRLLATIAHTQGLYVADNRTVLIERFMDTPHEWLLQIDTDIEFPVTLLETMLELAGDDKKILAATVPLGSAFPTCAFSMTEIPGIWNPITEGLLRRETVGGREIMVPIEGAVIPCDAIATAVCLVHRDVFADIAREHGQCWMHHMYLPMTNVVGDPRFRSQGEDLAFSLRAKATGYKVWCAYVPGLKHHKTQALSHDTDVVPNFSADPGVGELVEDA